MNANLKEKLESLPQDPGVYLMKDQGGKIIYVGKAKNLKNRVKSYFVGMQKHEPKTRKLVQEIEFLWRWTSSMGGKMERSIPSILVESRFLL